MKKIIFYILSIFWHTIVSCRNFLFKSKIIKQVYFRDIFVISIGNLAVGGTGKTPHCELIINNLKNKNFKVAFLSRGYKRKTKGFVYITDNSTPEDVGDEPLLIYKKTNVISAVCENRILAIKKLVDEHKPDIVVLDDALQYKKLLPNLSILLTQYDRPFFNDHFLPYGRLRDAKGEYLRANLIVVTNAKEDILPIEKEVWRANINIKPYQKLYFSNVKYKPLYNIHEQSYIELDELKDYNILLITGIANPHYIYDFYAKRTKNLLHIKYSDHKNYSQQDFDYIGTKFDTINFDKKIIVTTEKDYVKIEKILPSRFKKFLYVQPIEVDILFDQKNDFFHTIEKRIENFFNKK